MFTICFSWCRNQVENFRVPTTSVKVKVVTAERAFGVWNNKDSTFQFKLPSGICTADVDKVLYEEIMMNDDNLESNLLSSSLLKCVVCTSSVTS